MYTAIYPIGMCIYVSVFMCVNECGSHRWIRCVFLNHPPPSLGDMISQGTQGLAIWLALASQQDLGLLLSLPPQWVLLAHILYPAFYMGAEN